MKKETVYMAFAESFGGYRVINGELRDTKEEAYKDAVDFAEHWTGEKLGVRIESKTYYKTDDGWKGEETITEAQYWAYGGKLLTE